MAETRVKIVATVGPASRDPGVLAALARAGVDVFRVNGAHEPAAGIARLVADVRAASRRAGRTTAVLLDLPGVKRRVGPLPGGSLDLREGSRWRLVGGAATAATAATPGGIPVPAALLRALVPGAVVHLGDGQASLRVERTTAHGARARVVEGGEVRSGAGVHVAGATDPAPVPTPADRRLAAAAIEAGVDAVALSFVRGAADLARLHRLLERPGRPTPLVVAKVERREAVEALDEVLDVCDGVMVARGDLGLEYAPEEVPGLQKRILEAAARHGRFAVTATQMLESMTVESRPTRAEASDVANAVFDGTDAVMLSAETAVGRHPVLAVETMNRIVASAEADPHCPYAGDPRALVPTADPRRLDRLVVRAAVRLAQDLRAQGIVVFTRGGQSARRLAKERPAAPVYAYASDDTVVRGLAFSWGVRPRRLPAGRSTDALIAAVSRRLRRDEGLRPGARVVLVMGGARDPAGTTSLVKVVSL